MVNQAKIKTWVEQAVKDGPIRVVIHSSGEATTPERAHRDHQITPEIIYVRDDGWSLGCPAYLDYATSRLWEDVWVAVTWRDGHGGWRWRRWGDGFKQAMEVEVQ